MNSIKKRNSNFTTVSNSFLRDERISFKAKGLFCYMFSMADGWNFTMQSIATQQKDGLDSIKSAMNELKKYGYVVYEKHQNGKGTYHLDDEPKVENPHVENPKLGKSTPIKKEQPIKKNNTKNVDYEYFMNAWNKFAEVKKKKRIIKLSNDRKTKLRTRGQEVSNFNNLFIETLMRAGESEFLISSNWFDFDWIVSNSNNYIKVLEGKYDDK